MRKSLFSPYDDETANTPKRHLYVSSPHLSLSSPRPPGLSSQRGASVMESCLAVALVGLAVFTAASTFGGSLSDKILHGIVPGLGGPQSLQVAGARSGGGGDQPDTGSVGGGGGGYADEGDVGSVGGGGASPPDWEPDTGSAGGVSASPPDWAPDTGGVGGVGGGDSYGDTGSVGGGAADGGDPGSEE